VGRAAAGGARARGRRRAGGGGGDQGGLRRRRGRGGRREGECEERRQRWAGLKAKGRRGTDVIAAPLPRGPCSRAAPAPDRAAKGRVRWRAHPEPPSARWRRRGRRGAGAATRGAGGRRRWRRESGLRGARDACRPAPRPDALGEPRAAPGRGVAGGGRPPPPPPAGAQGGSATGWMAQGGGPGGARGGRAQEAGRGGRCDEKDGDGAASARLAAPDALAIAHALLRPDRGPGRPGSAARGEAGRQLRSPRASLSPLAPPCVASVLRTPLRAAAPPTTSTAPSPPGPARRGAARGGAGPGERSRRAWGAGGGPSRVPARRMDCPTPATDAERPCASCCACSAAVPRAAPLGGPARPQGRGPRGRPPPSRPRLLAAACSRRRRARAAPHGAAWLQGGWAAGRLGGGAAAGGPRLGA
jgi:hypothetical protein